MKSAPSIRCAVIQLSGVSTTLQSLMALRAAHQLYPRLEITLITSPESGAAAKHVPWIKAVVELPTEALIAGSLEEAAKWMAPLTDSTWDMVVNWSFTESSSFLTALLPSRVKLGFTRRPDLTLSSPDGWSHYVQAVLQGGIEQNIHFTDILTTQLLTALQIHLGDPADAGDAAVTSKGFFTLKVPGDSLMAVIHDHTKKWIGIQLSPDGTTSGWNADNWGELAVYLLNRHPDCGVVLLSENADSDDNAETVLKYVADLAPHHWKRVVNAADERPFDSWAAIVGRCQWMITADGAGVQLASILGTRVLNISTGDSSFSENGPYGNGHYVLRAASIEKITSEAVYSVWSYASSEWSHRREVPIEKHFVRLGFDRDLEQIDILRSRIRAANDGGGVTYESVIARPMALEDWASQVMGYIARAWYCGWLPPIGHELERKRIHPRLVQQLRQIDDASLVLMKICDEAKRTAIRLQERSSKLKSDRIMPLRAREELRNLGRKLMELDQLVERLASAQKPLQGFARMSKVLMHNLKGKALSELGRESAESYAQLGYGVAILRDWVKHTLQMTKPMAVAAPPAERSL